MTSTMILARSSILIKVTYLEQFALELWVSIITIFNIGESHVLLGHVIHKHIFFFISFTQPSVERHRRSVTVARQREISFQRVLKIQVIILLQVCLNVSRNNSREVCVSNIRIHPFPSCIILILFRILH